MKVDGVEAAPEVPEGLGADGLDVGGREINLSKLAQSRKLAGRQARDVVLAQDNSLQSLVAVKKFDRKFFDIVVFQVNFSQDFDPRKGIFINPLYSAIFQ